MQVELTKEAEKALKSIMSKTNSSAEEAIQNTLCFADYVANRVRESPNNFSQIKELIDDYSQQG